MKDKMQENSNLSVLVVDPNPGMRGNLQNMLGQAGISKIEFAVSSGTAIRALSRRAFDIILCEYDLGADTGQDGQQLLEDLRHHQLIGLSAIFIMLTSEGVMSKVVSAAELTPTDYVLKPFTMDDLGSRITRALDRRAALLPAWQLVEQAKLRDAIGVCMDAERHPRYASDFARLRAELHVRLDELTAAQAVYASIVADKPLGWAILGLARVLYALGRAEDARATIERLLAANPRLMVAYDLLARCHLALGDPVQAQKVLEEAVVRSPHVVRRLRTLGEVAYDAGDFGASEKSLKLVVSKARYSEFRDPEDHVKLVRTLVARGDVLQAGTVVRDLEKSLRASPTVDACKAVSMALVHEASGNADAATAELLAAVSNVRAGGAISGSLRMDLARSCLAHRMDDAASDVMLSALGATDGITHQQALNVFVKAGRHDLANGIGAQLKAQAQILLGVADEKRKMGDVRGAVITLQEAIQLAPSNIQVMVALAGGSLRQILELGWDNVLAENCSALLQKIATIDIQHPRLEALQEEYAAAKRKYGIAL
ncbi:MAG: response regulator [Pseudomonadota bacterium]|nr:response regulator [Pseudomonadota bacterium]